MKESVMKKIISILLVLITMVSTEVLANNVDNNIQSSNYSNVEDIISDIEFDDIYSICIYRNINNYTEVIEISNREDIVYFLNQFQRLVVFQDNISSDSNIRIDFWMKKSTPHTKNIYNVKHGFKKKNEWINQFISESDLEDIIRDMDIEWRVNNSGASPVNQEMVYPVKMKPESDISVVIDGEQVAFDVPPQIIEERTFVPMRAIFEALGADVQWWDTTKTVYAKKPLGGNLEKTVTLAIGEKTMTVSERNVYRDSIKTLNETGVELNVPAQIVGDRTLVPVRAISESLDCTVKWDGDERKVIIISSPEKVIGTATINEMRCLIDYQPIDFINVDGFTYIKATDLEDYGFDVTEDNGDIYINRNKTKLPLLIDKYKNGLVDEAWFSAREYPYVNYCHSVMDIWVKPQYGKKFDIFETNSNVFLDGTQCNVKNINGDIYIQADELQKYGKVTWIDAKEYYNEYHGSRYGNGYSEIRGDTLDIHVATDDLEKVHERMYPFPENYTGYVIIDHGEHYGVEHGIYEYKNGKANGMGYRLNYYIEIPSGLIYSAGEYEDGKLKNGITISNVPEANGDYIALYEVNDFEKTQLYPKE